jgi:hypothetical protein
MTHEVRVNGRLVYWPSACACCMVPADEKYRLIIKGSAGGDAPPAWEVPYCSLCLAHVRQAVGHSGPPPWVRAAVVLAFVVVGLTVWALGSLAFAVLTTVTLALGAAALLSLGERRREVMAGQAGTLCHSGCAGAGPAAYYRGWDGSSHGFAFTNMQFAEAFAEANTLEEEPGARTRSRRVRRLYADFNLKSRPPAAAPPPPAPGGPDTPLPRWFADGREARPATPAAAPPGKSRP